MQLPWLKKYNLLIFDEIDSTNSEAIRLIKSGVYGDFLIWAQSQTSGRGRQNRTWISGVGNLYISLLLNRDIPINKQPQLSFLSSIAVHDTISYLARGTEITPQIKLKWPNDVLVNSKKISGILLESMKMNERNHLVIGIGINLENCPNLLSQETTCLINEKIIYRDIGQVLNLFMHYFDKHYAYWSKRGFLKIRRLWLSKAINLNQVVTVDNGVDRISGVFKDIDLNGNMRLQISSGQICSFGAGDVFFTKEEDILG